MRLHAQLRLAATAAILLQCLSLCAGLSCGRRSAVLQEGYDAIVLALQWPTTRINTQAHPAKLAATYASALAKHQVASSWTIHGFWPTNAAGPSGSPSYCGADSNLTYSQARCMDGIIPTVNYYWPDLTAGRPVATNGSTALWEHEWAKHGSCYGSTYFIDATLVAAGLNLTEVLLEGGIVPSASQPYHVGDIRRAISASLGDVLWPGQELICAHVPGSTLPQLAEIRLCIDKTTLLPLKDCSSHFPPVANPRSCRANDTVLWLPLPRPEPSWTASFVAFAFSSHPTNLALWILGGLALVAGIIWLLVRLEIINPIFMPARVTVIHNPLVRQPMVIYAESIDLDEIANVDPGIATAAASLGYGMGIKGGIARKMLKILHGTPEAVTDDFDVDCILLAERGLTPEEQTELRKTVTGMKMGHLVLEPKDVEVLSKEELRTYWITRDICLNEVLLMRMYPGAPLTLFFSAAAAYDATHSIIRSIPHALKSDFTECWTLDGDQPILSPKHVARTILRYFKGHGNSYQFDEATWAYYRREKLSPVTLFQVLRAVHADTDKYRAVVNHLIDVGLLSSAEVRSKGGFDGLWGATLHEVNDKMAQFGGRLCIDELDVDAVERWIVQKRAQMRSLPYKQRERASRTGYIPAEEDTLSLGLITFPQELLEYIEHPGGLWDPEHPEGAPPSTPTGRPQLARPSPRLPEPLVAGGAAEAVVPTLPPSRTSPQKKKWKWLSSLSHKFGSPPAAASRSAGLTSDLSLTAPLLPPALPGPHSSDDHDTHSRHTSSVWQGEGGEGSVQFIPARDVVEAAPAVPAHEGRLGMAWMRQQQLGSSSNLIELEKETLVQQEASNAANEGLPEASRYSGPETILFMCRIAVAAWPLLLLSTVLLVVAVGLHLYQLRIQSEILNLAIAGKKPLFLSRIFLLTKLCLLYVFVNWLSNITLQLYLRRAMEQLYTGLFTHVMFQDSTFYDSISTSELVTRTGVDMMNLRVLMGFLVQKLVKGLTQVTAGVTLLAIFAGPMIGKGLTATFCLAIAASVWELYVVSMIIRKTHRFTRSMLGRLYGFSNDVFTSIQGVVALALQRNFTETYTTLATNYFQAAMMLNVWMSSHQLFLETIFSAFVTVAVLYIGGTAMLAGRADVGIVYAMLRYIAVVEQGYMGVSEGVARFFASYGSLERVIDLHQRGQLTRRGKPAVLEALEREESALSGTEPPPGSALIQVEENGSGVVPLVGSRLTAANWAGGLRCNDIIYGYKGRPGNVLFSLNLELQPGELVLVKGEAQCGRSTLVHLLHLDIAASGGSLQFQTRAGNWVGFHPTSTDRYEMQQRMGFVSPGACAVFFATVLENMVCACTSGRLPSVADCQEAAELTGFDADIAQLPDGYQTLVGAASRVELIPMVRLRLGLARLLLLNSPCVVLIDAADRFLTATPRLPDVLARLRQKGAAVVLTAVSSCTAGLEAVLPQDTRTLILEGGRLRAAGAGPGSPPRRTRSQDN